MSRCLPAVTRIRTRKRCIATEEAYAASATAQPKRRSRPPRPAKCDAPRLMVWSGPEWGARGHDDTDAARHYSEAAGLPLRGYLVTLATCSGLVTALTVLARVTGSKAPACVAPGDVLLTAVATYKLRSLVTKDPVTRPLRAPFSSYEGTQGPSRALGVTARSASASSSPARSARRRGSARAWPPGSSSCGGRGARRWGRSPCWRERTFLQYAHAWLMQKAE
jgi:hypothetical protein